MGAAGLDHRRARAAVTNRGAGRLGAYVWLGAIFYVDVSLAALDVGRAIFEGVAYASAGASHGEGVGAARAFAARALTIAGGLVTMGLVRGRGAPSIVRVRVPIADLPAAFEGFRIVQRTDVHIDPLLRRTFARRLVDAVRALEPDLVAVKGDLVDGGVTDLDAARRDRDVSLPVILLAHQPRSIEHAERARVALQISGHTHGGQMQPFGALVRMEQPLLRGLARFGSTALWVSQGTGTWGPPLRVGTRSEISVIELARV